MKLTRKKLDAGAYHLVDPAGRVVARIDRTGEYGRDNYPWDWHLFGKLNWAWPRKDGREAPVTGTAETLKDCIEIIEYRVNAYGLIEGK
ncbi:hypothetical protein ACMX2H_18300 [Arthrobacter sulfonylureivorans]|uniref:hypothetical protein n=1 Tax=Arthrobacter sulfonylureivorans TaxID=2486855 RepID=UPI0039E706CD